MEKYNKDYILKKNIYVFTWGKFFYTKQKNDKRRKFDTFLKYFIYLLLEKERQGRKRGTETSTCGCLSRAPTGDLARNPGMRPDWESNQQPFDSKAGDQSTEPHQPGQKLNKFN